MGEKKYKLTDETIKHKGRVLRRIGALKDFADVKKGDKGGYVESEKKTYHRYVNAGYTIMQESMKMQKSATIQK